MGWRSALTSIPHFLRLIASTRSCLVRAPGCRPPGNWTDVETTRSIRELAGRGVSFQVKEKFAIKKEKGLTASLSSALCLQLIMSAVGHVQHNIDDLSSKVIPVHAFVTFHPFPTPSHRLAYISIWPSSTSCEPWDNNVTGVRHRCH
jgi:hypothetical protein